MALPAILRVSQFQIFGSANAGTGRALLLDAINIWATNVVMVALWFWTLDRGSPSSRGLVLPDRRDFLFTQQQQASDTNPTFAD